MSGYSAINELGNFCKETTIHGLNHVFEDMASWIRKILWLFIILLSFFFAGSFLQSSIQSQFFQIFKVNFDRRFALFQHG